MNMRKKKKNNKKLPTSYLWFGQVNNEKYPNAYHIYPLIIMIIIKIILHIIQFNC